jgi:hypothetical protein
MKHFAQIDSNNVVTQVIVIQAEHGTSDIAGQTYINNILGLSGTWLLTSPHTRRGLHEFRHAKTIVRPRLDGKGHHTINIPAVSGIPLRKNYAQIGHTYDKDTDAFVHPKPSFECKSWTINATTGEWTPPVPYPTDGGYYKWNETSTTWSMVSAASAMSALLASLSALNTHTKLTSGIN